LPDDAIIAATCDYLRPLSAHNQHTEHRKHLKEKADLGNPTSRDAEMVVQGIDSV
jgi:hypothetical protein